VKQNLLSIQYLRFFAAACVVIFHLREPHVWLYDPWAAFDLGRAGVSLFFMISGFIMYQAARFEAPIEFLKRRVIRIVPLYWLMSGVYMALAVLNHSVTLNPEFGAHIAKSLLFIPHYNLRDPSLIAPFLIPGWSLDYEMFFYALFALGLWLKRLELSLCLILGALVLMGVIWPPKNAIMSVYENPILLEFLLGMGLGLLHKSHNLKAFWPLLPIGLLVDLVAGFSVQGAQIGEAIAVLSGAMILIGALGLEQSGRVMDNKALALLGNASFSLYLSHQLAISLVAHGLEHVHLQGVAQFILLIIGGLSLSLIMAVGVYLGIEKPLTRWAKGLVFHHK